MSFRAFLNGSVRHESNEIGRFASETHLMRDQDNGLVRFAKTGNHVKNLSGHLRIERGCRLIHQEKLRLDGERPGNRHALPLTAAQLRRLLSRVRIKAQALEDLPRTLLSIRKAMNFLERQQNILQCSQVGKEIEGLKYYADFAPMLAQGSLFENQTPPIKKNHALIGMLQAGEHAQQGGLAPARRPNQRDCVIKRSVKVDVS